MDEESDLDYKGESNDHFSQYIDAMEQIGASTRPILVFTKSFDSTTILDHNLKDFINFNTNVVYAHPPHIVAGIFFYGREKIIPEMFATMLREVEGFYMV